MTTNTAQSAAPIVTTTAHRAAGRAAAVGAIASTVAGAVQAVRSDDGNPLVGTSEHVLLSLVAVALVLWIPGYLALAGDTGRMTGRIGGWLSVAGTTLLAFGMTATNLHDQDYSWFPVVAVPANLFWLLGSILLAVATWRARTLPRPLSIGVVLVWPTSIILSQAGGNLVTGIIWAFLAWSLLNPRPRQ
jgi:hypothetical protein